MKKVKNEMRRSYKKSDFTKLERGKFYAEAAKGTSVAILDPVVAMAFPTSRAVNKALLELLPLQKKSPRATNSPTQTSTKSAR